MNCEQGLNFEEIDLFHIWKSTKKQQLSGISKNVTGLLPFPTGSCSSPTGFERP
jgi:hypothetical protein